MKDAAWFSINEAYSEDYDRTAEKVASQQAPAVRFGELWDDSLESARQRELEGLDEYRNRVQQDTWDIIMSKTDSDIFETGTTDYLPANIDDNLYLTVDEVDEGIKRIEEARARVRAITEAEAVL